MLAVSLGHLVLFIFYLFIYFFYEGLCNSAMHIHIASVANTWHTLIYNNMFPSDDVKVLHCVTEVGKVFQTEHMLGTKE